MKVIRQNVFETNSSSMHSICVLKRDRYINPKDLVWDFNKEVGCNTVFLSNGKWDLRDIDEGYGRHPFQLLTTFEEKFQYAMCEFLGSLYEDDPEWQRWYDEFKNIAVELLPGFKDFRINTKDIDIYLDEDGNDIMQKDLHYDHWNSEKQLAEYYYLDENGDKHPAKFDEENYLKMPNIGMIDHQSAGLLKNFLISHGIDLKEFLTNKKYIVVIDGDEYNTWGAIRETDLIDKSNIEEEYYTSDDDIEFQNWLEEQKENEKSNEE